MERMFGYLRQRYSVETTSALQGICGEQVHHASHESKNLLQHTKSVLVMHFLNQSWWKLNY